MPAAAAAVRYTYERTSTSATFKEVSAGSSAIVGARYATADLPASVIGAGRQVGDGWVLRLPLLYDLQPGEDGVLATAPALGGSGYGAHASLAIESLLDGLVEALESLNDMADNELDGSAHRLRNSLRKQFSSIVPSTR